VTEEIDYETDVSLHDRWCYMH